MKLRIALLSSSCFAALAACGPDRGGDGGENNPPPLKTIEKSSALAAANTNVRAMLVGSAQSALFVDQAQLIGKVADEAADCNTTSPEGSGSGASGCVDLAFEDSATALADRIAEKLLNVANIELEESTRIVLKLIPEAICETDTTCITAFNANPIRLELTSRTEGDVDVGVLVGEAKANPINVSLHRSELAVEIDLGAAKVAAENILRAMNAGSIDVPSVLSGRVRLAIEKSGEHNFAVSFGVVSPIEVVVEDGAERFEVHVAAANPALTARVDGDAKTLSVASSFAAISGEMPLSSMFTDAAGVLAFQLGAAKARTTLRANEENAVVEGIDLGNGLAITVDGRRLIAADVNVNTVKVASLADGLRVSVAPSLMANVSLDYRTIADRVNDVPSWALDEDLTLELNGAAEPAVSFDDTSDSIRVDAGTMTIRSRAAGRTVTVPSNMCLIAIDAPQGMDAMNPVELLSSGMCE